MLKFTLIMAYAVGIAYSTYMKEKVFEQWFGFNGPYGQERITNHTHYFDDVASGGLLNPTALGLYGDTYYKLTYDTFGELKRPYSYLRRNHSATVFLRLTSAKAVAKASELSQTLGIVPNSNPNTVYYGGVNGLLSAKKEARILVPNVYYIADQSYFKPRSFWFGCLTLSAIPGSCTVTVTSRQALDPAESQVFKFQATPLATSMKMTKAVFYDNFTWVDDLIFTTVYDTVDLLGVTLIDDFFYGFVQVVDG